jgi:hypothetical protein
MSEIKVNKISPRTNCGTTTLGDSGDTFTIPSGVTISNLGTASGFGGTGEISWDTTVKTTGTFTPTAGIGYFLNTTGGTITVNLPAGVAGSSVAFADYAGTWQDNNVTVSPNGTEKIGGTNADVTLNTEGQSVQFVYIDGTQGWVNVIDSTSNVRATSFITATGGCITTCGNCKMHTFLSPATFTVCSVGSPANNNLVSYMVVAGGGGAGAGYGGGGGGGGFRELVSPSAPYSASPLDGYSTPGNRITVTATSYPITVGAGGTGSTGPGAADGTRGASSIFSSITSTGGGAGGDVGPVPAPVRPGGSGGGGSAANPSYPVCGGTGNDPPVSPAQGQNGGSGYCGNDYRSGGGGGATVAGTSSPNGIAGGCGGTGATTSISASPTSYSGGGGGGQYTNFPAGGAASPCGTGKAASFTQGPGPSAAANTGGGGGGGAGNTSPGQNGGNGGSGIVIIRYRYQ